MPLTDKFDIIIPPQDIACEPGLQQKLADGDKEAFAWVYKNYCRKIYNYAFVMTNDSVISEDLVQEVFLTLWIKREKLRYVEDFNSYLFIMGRNITAGFLRKQFSDNWNRIEFAKTVASEVFCQEKTIAEEV